MTATRRSTVTLRDGRRLAYLEFGDPAGVPLMWFHGWPSSASGAMAFGLGETAAELGIRLVCPDRPGIGSSDARPGRTFCDWPSDVVELADALGLGRFGVMSWSAGSPYALACARYIPERLTTVGVVSGLSRPWREPGATDELETKLLWNLARVHPRLVELALKGMVSRVVKAEPGALPASAKQAMMTQPDFEFLLANPSWNDRNLAASLEGVVEQTYGTAYESSLYWKPWGFALPEIETPVFTWHGDTDGSAPYPAQGMRFAEDLRYGQCTVYPGEGHLTVMAQHAEEILRTLRDAARTQ